jgi:hypothetical protein
MPTGTPLTLDQQERAVKLYQEGHSAPQVARLMGLPCRKTIERALKRRGCPVRPFYDPIDVTFFDTIDTRQKAYWLGWMMSDGCNSVKEGRIAIQLNAKDIEVLLKLQRYIGHKGKLRQWHSDSGYSPNGSDVAGLMFKNRRLSDALVRLGCGNAKTKTLTFPICVPDHLMRDFVRGYIEGDGNFGYQERKKAFSVGVLGTQAFIEGLAATIKVHLGIECPVYPSAKVCPWMCVINKSARLEVMAILDWLYVDCEDMFLERKYQTYLRLKALHETLPMPTRYRPVGGTQWANRTPRSERGKALREAALAPR